MKLHWSLSAASLLTVVDGAGVGNFFTYYETGGLGPSRWPLLNLEGTQCGGMSGSTGSGQSPVTITRAVEQRCDTDMKDYKFNPGTCTWDELVFEINNNGVLVKPNPDSSCSFGSMEIPHTDNPFNALQFHIHTYSEHEIRGKGTRGFFPAELHVVHQEETKESFAVFGTMIDVGETAHPVFEDFLRGWERTAEQVAKECRPSEDPFAAVQTKVTCGTVNDVLQEPTVLPSGSFFPDEAPNVYGLPTTEDFGVFTYKGGLTTPGCTEIVN